MALMGLRDGSGAALLGESPVSWWTGGIGAQEGCEGVGDVFLDGVPRGEGLASDGDVRVAESGGNGIDGE